MSTVSDIINKIRTDNVYSDEREVVSLQARGFTPIVNLSKQYDNKHNGGVQGKQRRTKRSNKRRKKKRNNRRRGETLGGVLLPDINNKPAQSRCIRYSGSVGSGTTALFNTQDIRSFVGFTNSGSTAYYPLTDAFKLLRVGLTLLPNDVSSAGTVTFVWNGFNAPDYRDTMLVANSIPYHRSFKPLDGTSASWWWDNSSSTTDLFSIRSALNTDCVIILDIELKYIIATGAITSVPLTTTSSLNGLVYRLLPITGLNFTPVELDVDQ